MYQAWKHWFTIVHGFVQRTWQQTCDGFQFLIIAKGGPDASSTADSTNSIVQRQESFFKNVTSSSANLISLLESKTGNRGTLHLLLLLPWYVFLSKGCSETAVCTIWCVSFNPVYLEGSQTHKNCSYFILLLNCNLVNTIIYKVLQTPVCSSACIANPHVACFL